MGKIMDNKLLERFRSMIPGITGEAEVKLSFTNCGEIMINGLDFSFGLESAGASSKKGLCVTISGEAVDKGDVTFTDLRLIRISDGKPRTVRREFPRITKKDGKRIYQARFESLRIGEATVGNVYRGSTDAEVRESIDDQFTFRVTPPYSGEDPPEVMLSVYPYENPLGGSATQWLNVTADEDYFLHRNKKKKRR